MGFRANCVGLLLAGLPVAGCGTVSNTVLSRPEDGGKTPFGGVRQDAGRIRQAADGAYTDAAHHKPGAEPSAGRSPQVGLMLLFAADLPFTIVGDLLTWPYTWSYSVINQPTLVPPVVFTAPPVAPAILPAPVTPTLPPPRVMPAMPMALPPVPEAAVSPPKSAP